MNEKQEYQIIPPKPEIKEVDNFNWIVPECCREGWPSCPHVIKKQRKVKRNIAL